MKWKFSAISHNKFYDLRCAIIDSYSVINLRIFSRCHDNVQYAVKLRNPAEIGIDDSTRWMNVWASKMKNHNGVEKSTQIKPTTRQNWAKLMNLLYGWSNSRIPNRRKSFFIPIKISIAGCRDSNLCLNDPIDLRKLSVCSGTLVRSTCFYWFLKHF